jgi:hypothetical protein
MNRMNPLVAIGLLLGSAVALTPSQAQTVWRCGEDGRSFSDRPCADGQRLQMAAWADRPSAHEVLVAQEVAARQQRLADVLRQERLLRARVAAPPLDPHAVPQGRHGGAGFKAKREAKMQREEVSLPPRHRSPAQSQRASQQRPPAADGIWRAVAPSSPRTKD